MVASSFFTQAVTAAALLSSFTSAVPLNTIHKRQSSLKFPYGTEKVRGVNLGGWFVLEPWITPSIFQPWADNQLVVDEWTLCETLGPDQALTTLQNHWNTWITQDDFNQIAALGLNFVRIPIGFWSIIPLENGEPYVAGAYEILGQALDWAEAAGLKVLIDLHGAPNSQNGFDNSGHRGSIGWTQGDSVARTVNAINQIRDDHASHPAVAAIELVNEPMGPSLDMGTIEQYYTTGYDNLQGTDVAVTMHDAFQGFGYWNEFLPGLPNILIDHHEYQVFDSGSLGMSPAAHVGTACSIGAAMAAETKWEITGEFTSAVTDCALWLNGLGVGARYDGSYELNGVGSSYIGSCDGLSTGTVDALPESYKVTLAQFTEAQFDAYEEGAGWIYWCWKTESAPEWNFQALAAAGIIPQPLTARNYPGQCA